MWRFPLSLLFVILIINNHFQATRGKDISKYKRLLSNTTVYTYLRDNMMFPCDSGQYYHDIKFYWKKGRQQQSYKRHQECLDHCSNMPSPKTSKSSKSEELQSYSMDAFTCLDMVLWLYGYMVLNLT